MTNASSVSDAGSAERARVLLADDHPALAGEYSMVGSVRDGYELNSVTAMNWTCGDRLGHRWAVRQKWRWLEQHLQIALAGT